MTTGDYVMLVVAGLAFAAVLVVPEKAEREPP